MLLPPLILRNIKIRVFLKASLNPFTETDINHIKEFGNFESKHHHQIIRLKNLYVFTVYKYSRNFINVTGLKSKIEITNIHHIIDKVFNASIKEIRIENMTFSRKVRNMSFSSEKILKLICSQDLKVFKFDKTLEGFHAPWIRSKYGSFNLFATGSVTVVGVSCFKNIKIIEKYLDHIYCPESFIKTLTE